MSIDDSLRHKLRPRSSILDELDAEPSAPSRAEPSRDLPSPDEIIPLPRASDDYKAHCFPEKKSLPTLRLLLGSPPARGFSYAHLDTIDMLEDDEPGGGLVIVMRFTGLTPTEVRIHGRQLELLYNYLSFYRISWVRQIPPKRDFRGADEVVVSRIVIRPIEG